MTVSPVSRSCINYVKLFLNPRTIPNIRSFSKTRALRCNNYDNGDNNNDYKRQDSSTATSPSSSTTTTNTFSSIAATETASDESLSTVTTASTSETLDKKIPTDSLSFLVANEKLGRLSQEAIAEQEKDDVRNSSSDKNTAKADNKKSFQELLMDSPLMRLGDFANSMLVGKITARVKDDLYIDYGGKFDCVCKVPKAKPGSKPPAQSNAKYRIGDEVIVMLKDHEMTARFMGFDKDMTLLESDARLVGVKFNATRKPKNDDASGLVSDGGLV